MATADPPARLARTRRDFLRKSALAGAAAWTAPTLASAVVAPVAAQTLGGTLYGVDSGSNTFHTVDRSTGAWSRTGQATGVIPREMTYHAGRGEILGIDIATPQRLHTVDASTGAWAPVGPLGTSRMAGIAYHAGNGNLYGCGDGQMWLIDPDNGRATALGAVTAAPVTMAYDTANAVFYGVDGNLDALFKIDVTVPDWSLASAINLGVDNIAGLAYDSDLDVLYGCSTSTDAMYTINRNTGSANSLGATMTNNPAGLAFVP